MSIKESLLLAADISIGVGAIVIGVWSLANFL